MPKIRVKTHQMPGDIPKRKKIALLEGRVNDATLVYRRGSKGIAPIIHEYTTKQAKSFKKVVISKERAVQKRLTRKEIKEHEAEAVMGRQRTSTRRLHATIQRYFK